jgi:beta-galactosidase
MSVDKGLLERFPFLFGAEYYRAPTPGPECWEQDFRGMRDLGFTSVKYIVQWRWSHRRRDRFTFDDLDRLMDLAAAHRLGVTLNFFFDVAPVWLYDVFPDAKPVDIRGRIIEPYAVGHRQIGGHPGPCYRHPGALEERRHFLSAAVEHFREHPGLQMWDVWNEPELCFPQRHPDISTMACYCPHCRAAFHAWLRAKYGTVDRLNEVWGRCYETWEQVELPRDTGTITDFVDWREFHLDTMAEEAAWRLDTVARLDPKHGRYLHVVPNSFFSAVTCDDDFAMAERCEVFASTMSGGPVACLHTLSAARGKVCYNVESHVNHGSTDMHQPVVGPEELRRDLLPQLGLGTKGVLFWQYRSETLGFESPAWGIVNTDGSSRPVTEAVRRFWATLRPHADALRRAFPAAAEIGVWRSRKNEIFHFCTQGNVQGHNASIAAYLEALYWESLPVRLVNDGMLSRGELDGLRMLVMPSCYYLTREEAGALDLWVRGGGVLLCEAHLGGYDGTIGRHSTALPGCGLAESWGLREVLSTAGGTNFPVRLWDGSVAWGAHRYAEIAGQGMEALGSRDGGAACIGSKRVGRGIVFYCGTNLGLAVGSKGAAGLLALVRAAAGAAGISAAAGIEPETPSTVHLDLLLEEGAPRFAVVVSRADRPQKLKLRAPGRWQGLFSGISWQSGGESAVEVPPGLVDLFVVAGG